MNFFKKKSIFWGVILVASTPLVLTSCSDLGNFNQTVQKLQNKEKELEKLSLDNNQYLYLLVATKRLNYDIQNLLSSLKETKETPTDRDYRDWNSLFVTKLAIINKMQTYIQNQARANDGTFYYNSFEAAKEPYLLIWGDKLFNTNYERTTMVDAKNVVDLIVKFQDAILHPTKYNSKITKSDQETFDSSVNRQNLKQVVATYLDDLLNLMKQIYTAFYLKQVYDPIFDRITYDQIFKELNDNLELYLNYYKLTRDVSETELELWKNSSLKQKMEEQIKAYLKEK
ncbi:hypothetical protein [Mycoplasmopsis gallopavonis]|uniref:Lipoprotein n=1 Tax=Mycoplasmopsis gallopavonis TaxID=76629 RepID=A0A449B0I7_9BACT|nr:hypothetical protein [Mycoplasmopsis gallopavonis]RIV17012.1 hypothetical protein D1113_00100 [Mycoplasmopsis gallopavonis]VEU73283.1 Uncharacterised protein [Mycoplasmopsis gallopavonis]